MKKILVVAIVAMSAVTAKAQTFYAEGGVNFANISSTSDGDVQDNNTLTTFKVGLMNQFGLSKVVDLETGLVLMGQGAKAETYFNGGNDYVKAKFNPLYVQVPLNLVVKIPTGGTTGLFVNAGPYAAIGVGGKSKFETKIGSLTSTREKSIKFNNDDPTTPGQQGAAYDRLKRFDFGANFGAGIDLSKLIIKVNYGLGLAKINSTQTNNNADDKNKYRSFAVTVGIPLNRN